MIGEYHARHGRHGAFNNLATTAGEAGGTRFHDGGTAVGKGDARVADAGSRVGKSRTRLRGQGTGVERRGIQMNNGDAGVTTKVCVQDVDGGTGVGKGDYPAERGGGRDDVISRAFPGVWGQEKVDVRVSDNLNSQDDRAIVPETNEVKDNDDQDRENSDRDSIDDKSGVMLPLIRNPETASRTPDTKGTQERH